MKAEKVFSRDGEYIIISDKAVTDDYLAGLSISDGRTPTWGLYWKNGNEFGDPIEFADLPDSVRQSWYDEAAKAEAP